MSLLPPQEAGGDCHTCDDYQDKDGMLIPRHMRITERVAVVGHLRAHRVNDSSQLTDAQQPCEQQQKYGNNDSHRSFLITTVTRKHLTPGITRRPERLLESDRQRVGGRV